METQKSAVNFGIKWGIILGLYCIIGTMILYIMGIKYFAGFFRFAPSVVYYALLFVAAVQFRKESGGYITLGQLFKGLFIAGLITTFLLFIFNFILYSVIDTNLSEEVKKYWMDWTYNM